MMNTPGISDGWKIRSTTQPTPRKPPSRAKLVASIHQKVWRDDFTAAIFMARGWAVSQASQAYWAERGGRDDYAVDILRWRGVVRDCDAVAEYLGMVEIGQGDIHQMAELAADLMLDLMARGVFPAPNGYLRK